MSHGAPSHLRQPLRRWRVTCRCIRPCTTLLHLRTVGGGGGAILDLPGPPRDGCRGCSRSLRRRHPRSSRVGAACTTQHAFINITQGHGFDAANRARTRWVSGDTISPDIPATRHRAPDHVVTPTARHAHRITPVPHPSHPTPTSPPVPHCAPTRGVGLAERRRRGPGRGSGRRRRKRRQRQRGPGGPRVHHIFFWGGHTHMAGLVTSPQMSGLKTTACPGQTHGCTSCSS